MPSMNSTLLSNLGVACKEGQILTDPTSCNLYAQDVYTRSMPAGVVLRPGSLNELAAFMAVLHQNGTPSVPRGGGMSYTGGLVPESENWAVLALGLLDRVLEVNTTDMTVTVEAGCTWNALHKALAGTRLRTPYWGTLSGIRATVGGSLSQNSIFWGSGQFGSAVDSVLSLTVVLADGTLVNTGSAAINGASPFFRHFGPDLTGLFCADTGALGVKAKATLRLIPELPAQEYLAFDFASVEPTLAAMSDIARSNLASECFAFDPYLQAQRMKRQSLASDVKSLAGVMKKADSLTVALKEGARIAMAGRRFMQDVDYSVQIIAEDLEPAGARSRADSLRRLCKQHGGREIENSIPKITRANPFGPLNSMLGPQGERWLPVHGLFPHSKFAEAFNATEQLFEQNRERSEALDVATGYLLATISTHCCVVEPVFFWPDELHELHEDAVEADHLARLPRRNANLEARNHVHYLRSQIIELYSRLGAAHLQIGRSYRYHEALGPGAARLIEAIKQAVDSEGLMNPGSLGL
ncbi:MAG: FAD-binding oxidoreductase [Gammaproteobacteria bacterium]|nr:FAD-binding oxidoreductase [Gammaproteobacteria bacterium]